MIDDRPGPGDRTRFLTLLFSFCALDLLSWPILFSYYLWVFADRSNFLNLDYMLDQHLRLGVDAFYSYGLLPVLLQHVLFVVFGRGYWPMIGCNLVVLVLFALFWSSFVRIVSNRWSFLFAVVAICPLLMCVNLNLPYQMVQVSMLFALLFLLKGKPEVALAISTIGCFSVPSLPLLLTCLLALYIVVDWWIGPERSIALLVRRLTPGVLSYGLIAVGLSAFFSYRSVLATALPFLGVKFYYGGSHKLDFGDLMTFVHPAGHSFNYYLGYYVGSPATWWILSSLCLVVMSALAVSAMIRNRKVDPQHAVVLFCAVLQVFFIVVAYRGDDQHGIYDPITAAGVLAGIASIPAMRWRNPLLILLTCVGLTGQAATVRRTIAAWKNTHRSAVTANLYGDPELGQQMTKILQIAETQKVMLMSNPTGVHHYYPALHSPDSWYLVKTQMFSSDHERVLSDLRAADVVVEDTAHIPYFTDRDPDVQAELRSMCLTDVMRDFQIWWRHPPDAAVCKVNQRQTAASGK